MALLAKRGNGSLIPSLRNDLSDFFDMDRFINRPFLGSSFLDGERYYRVPATNIRETEDDYIVEVAAPGMRKKDFEIELDNGLLEIKVEKEEENEDDKREYTRREYDYHLFYRAFNVPDSVNSEKIKAEYEDGILRVVLPKLLESRRKPVKEIAVV